MNSQIDPGEATFLGVVQGLTEFLPVSSSGHLVAFQHVLGLQSPEFLFDVVVHGGTLLAVLLVYGRDLLEIIRQTLLAAADTVRQGNARAVWRNRPYFRLAVYLLIGSVPAASAGLLFQDALEAAFGSLVSVGSMLLLTGAFLYGTRFRTAAVRDLAALRLRDSLAIGVAQSLALLPGVSRSGITISAGLFCGLNRDLSARFSFLLSVPAILGANLLQAYKAWESAQAINGWPLLVGGSTALITGYFALRVLLRFVHRGQLHHFSYYCWAVGASILALSWIGPIT